MKIKRREIEGIPVLDLEGRLWGGPEDMKLVDIVTELAKEGRLSLIMNFSGVSFIASNGLGVMVRARARYVAAGGVMAICKLNEKGKSILQVTRLILLFDAHETEEQALAALRKQG